MKSADGLKAFLSMHSMLAFVEKNARLNSEKLGDRSEEYTEIRSEEISEITAQVNRDCFSLVYDLAEIAAVRLQEQAQVPPEIFQAAVDVLTAARAWLDHKNSKKLKSALIALNSQCDATFPNHHSLCSPQFLSGSIARENVTQDIGVLLSLLACLAHFEDCRAMNEALTQLARKNVLHVLILAT